MYGKMQESGIIEIIPLICASAIWGQYPILSHPDSPQDAGFGLAAVAESLAVGSPFVSILSPLRAHHRGGSRG